VGAPTNQDVPPMTLDQAMAIFKFELPNWVWSITECWVSIRGYCAPDWIPGYQDHEDYGIEQVELEIAKPSGPRGGSGPDPTPAEFLMALLDKAKEAKARHRRSPRND
jgi:hypothetical protein